MSAAETVATVAAGAFFVGGSLLLLGMLCTSLYGLPGAMRDRHADPDHLFFTGMIAVCSSLGLCVGVAATALLIGGEMGVPR